MIAYRAEIWCNGCGGHFETGIPHKDFMAMPQLGYNLEQLAENAGWQIYSDLNRHVCPRCTRQYRNEQSKTS